MTLVEIIMRMLVPIASHSGAIAGWRCARVYGVTEPIFEKALAGAKRGELLVALDVLRRFDLIVEAKHGDEALRALRRDIRRAVLG